MPQLAPADWPPQLIWLAITFVALFFVITRIAIPRIGGVIEQRKASVESDLAAAQRLKVETDSAIAAYEAGLAQARAQAFAIEQEARNRLNGEIEAERRKLDAQLAERIAAAEAQIAEAKAGALREARAASGDVAGAIVRALTGAILEPSALARAVARLEGA